MSRSYLGFTAYEDNFNCFEPSLSLGWTKKGDLREKPHDHSQEELAGVSLTKKTLDPIYNYFGSQHKKVDYKKVITCNLNLNL